MQSYLADRALLGYTATHDDFFTEKRVVPGVNVLPHQQLWTDSASIPKIIHDTLVHRVGNILEVDVTNDGFTFGIDGYPSGTGVVVKRARKPLACMGRITREKGYMAYTWNASLGKAIPPGTAHGIGVALERVRPQDSRLECIGDASFELDPRMNAILVKKSIEGPLFISFYAYTGRYGLIEQELPTDPGLLHEQHGTSYGLHDGPTVGLHRGDVIGNLRGYVESLDNHRTIKATVLGELHGHVDGTFQGEVTGTFTGSAHIDGGEIAHIEAFAVGTSTKTDASFVVRAPGKHILLENEHDQQGTLELRDGKLVFDVPLSAAAANIGSLQSLDFVCTQLRALLGIRNSYAGIREAGVLTGVSDAEVERGLYFGQNRLAPVEGAFRIVREVNVDGDQDLVVQTPVDGVWTTIRPVGALGATTVGEVTKVAPPRPGVARANGARPVMVAGEALGDIVIPVTGNLVLAQVGGKTTSAAWNLANLVPFADTNNDFATLFVDIEIAPAPKRSIWRGELPLRRGALLEYGSAPHGNLEILATLSATATLEDSFTLHLPDAPRHFRQAIKFADNTQFIPEDNFFELINNTYMTRAGRGAIDVIVKPITKPLAAPAIIPSTYLVRPLTPMGVSIINAIIGSNLIVYLDGVQLVSRNLEATRIDQSLGSLFTNFRPNPRRVRVIVTHPTAISGYLEFDVYAGLPAVAYTNGLQTWTGLVAYSWSQVPNATNIVASFTESSAGNSQVIKVPLECIAAGGNVQIDHQFRDGTFQDDTLAYTYTQDATHKIITYPNRRGATQVRLRSVVS